MERIRWLTESINPLKIKVDESSDKMQKTIEELNKTNQELKDSSHDIDKVIQNLEKNICDQVKCIGDKMDKLLSPSSGSASNYMENCELNVDYFVKSTSFLGLQVLYCCALLEKSKRDLYLSDFCSKIGGSWNDNVYYVWGFLVAAKSAGYIDFISQKKDNRMIFKEIKCNQLLTVNKIKRGLQQMSNSDKYRIEIEEIEDFCNEK